MKLILAALLALPGCALLRGETVECTATLATVPVTITGCLAESWDPAVGLKLHPCGAVDAGP